MLIRFAVAISDKKLEKILVMKLMGISIILKSEFDIAIYSDDFDKLLNNAENTDILISDFKILQNNKENLHKLYTSNCRCLPVLIDPDIEKLHENLALRPIEYISDINTITPEDEKDKIRKVCDFYTEIISKGFENKTDNSVLYITTKQDSYAIPKNSILYCQSDLKYTVFVIDDGTLVRKADKLQTIEEKYLWDFKRVHQSFLVNPQKIESIDKTTGEIVLTNHARIPFSRKYASEVRNLFKN